MPFFSDQIDDSSGSQEPLAITFKKDSFDRLISIDLTNPLPKDLDFESLIDLIQLIDFLRMPQFATSYFKNNLNRSIARTLTENDQKYAKNISYIIKNKSILNALFKNGELFEAIKTLFDTSQLPEEVNDLFSPYSHTQKEKPRSAFCLSYDGKYIFQTESTETEIILNKKEIKTDQVTKTISTPAVATKLQHQPEVLKAFEFSGGLEHIMNIVATDRSIAAAFSSGRVIIWDQETFEQRYEFSLQGKHGGSFDFTRNDTASDYFIIATTKPFFSTSQDGRYLFVYFPNIGFAHYFNRRQLSEAGLVEDAVSVGVGSASMQMHVIDIIMGTTKTFDFYGKFQDILFDKESKNLYRTTDNTLTIFGIDSNRVDKYSLPLSILYERYNLLYELGDFLWIQEYASQKSHCYTFNTKTKIIEDRGPMASYRPLYLSDTEVACAYNFMKFLPSGRNEKILNNSIFLDNPQKIEQIQDPALGKSLLKIDSADFIPETVSFDKTTFIFSDKNSRNMYVFQKQQPNLPFEITLGILYFQKVGDLNILGPIRAALKTSLARLPKQIESIVQNYFFKKLKTSLQKNMAIIKQLPTGMPKELPTGKPSSSE